MSQPDSSSLSRRELGSVNKCISSSIHPLLMETPNSKMSSICSARTGKRPVSEEVTSFSLCNKQQQMVNQNISNIIMPHLWVCINFHKFQFVDDTS